MKYVMKYGLASAIDSDWFDSVCTRVLGVDGEACCPSVLDPRRAYHPKGYFPAAPQKLASHNTLASF